MKATWIMAGAAILLPVAAGAQDDARCGPMIEKVADRIPDLSENPDAHRKLGLTVEQLQAMLATLDAARLVKDTDEEGCIDLVQAAQSVLERHGGN